MLKKVLCEVTHNPRVQKKTYMKCPMIYKKTYNLNALQIDIYNEKIYLRVLRD